MSTTASYQVSGMTCAHCVKAVTEELDRLDAVTSVEIDLVPGGDSRVRVTQRPATAARAGTSRRRRGRILPGRPTHLIHPQRALPGASGTFRAGEHED